MRRLVTLLAAAAIVAGPLAASGVAVSGEHRDRGGREEHQGGGEGRWAGGGRWSGGDRGGGDRNMAPVPVFRGGGGDYRGGGRFERADPRSDPRGDPRYENRGEYRSEPRFDPRYDPRTSGPPPSAYSAAPRRGGYLGPGAGEVIQNPASQRLRPAPRGYEWVRTSRGNALVSRSTGQVFDVVPY